jgi:radical SAM superfamily enzyme YgiQ (UPF0313 family)
MGWAYLERLRHQRERESGGLPTGGAFRVALCYPNRYAVAASSLGWQTAARIIADQPDCAAARAVLPDPDVSGALPAGGVLTFEDEAPLGAYPVVAFSISYEMDLPGIVSMLDTAGIPALRGERGEDEPFVLMGGPLTLSNPIPLAPFADAVAIGEAEESLPRIVDVLRASNSKEERLARLAVIPGVYVPAAHGEHAPKAALVSAEHLPAHALFRSPDAELADMFLVETGRGCPRYCKFCVARATNSPARYADLGRILSSIPPDSPKVGFVGAAVSEHPHIKDALRACVDRGQQVSLSSLRADRLDDELVELLAKGGLRTLTIASDAPSQRQRNKMAKGLKAEHIRAAAELARRHGLHRLKIYAIIGLPGENDEDIDELAALALELSALARVTLAVNPLVPKLRTPLADAPFTPVAELDRRIVRLRSRVQRRVELRVLSPRWAWVEMRLSLGGPEAGLAAMEAGRAGGGFSAWKKALGKGSGAPT